MTDRHVPPRVRRSHDRMYVARVRRTVVAGEQISVALELLADDQTAELADGDEFVTVLLAVDPFKAPTQ